MSRTPRFGELARRLLAEVIGFIQAFREQKKGASVKVGEAEKAASEQGNVPPFVKVQLVESVEVHKSADETANDKNYQSKTLLVAWLSFAVACLTLISLIVYAYITHGQLVEMRRATVAATKSANAATTSLHLDQRAWIGPAQRGDFQWKIGDQMRFPSRIVNTGKTPAIAVESVTTSTTMSLEEMPEFTYEPGTGHPTIHNRSAILYGSGSNPITFDLPVYKKGTRSGEILKLTPTLLAEMQSKKSFILIYGRITYQDVFGVGHWTNFCSIYPEPNQAASQLAEAQKRCIAYNAIDKSE